MHSANAWNDAKGVSFDGGWIEVTNPKPREPRYLYPLGKVWPLIQDMKPSGLIPANLRRKKSRQF